MKLKHSLYVYERMFDSSAKKAEASAKTDDEDSSDDEEEDAIGEKGKAPNALLMEVCTHL